MSDRAFVYIDGESHFIRSENAWRNIHGPEASLDRIRYVGQTDERLILVLPKAKVFWTRKMNPGVRRAIYFTAGFGDAASLHEIKLKLLEPSIIPERRDLALQRQNVLQTQQLIEKPKGVDITLAVTMLEHAYHDAFEVCHLYTSDVDFLPVIEAVRARGKQVLVHGYKNGLSEQSPLLHVPDQFIDLDEILRNECELFSPQQPPSNGN